MKAFRKEIKWKRKQNGERNTMIMCKRMEGEREGREERESGCGTISLLCGN